MQMDILPELDGGALPDLPDYISPQAAPANQPLLSEDQGKHKFHSAAFKIYSNSQGQRYHIALC